MIEDAVSQFAAQGPDGTARIGRHLYTRSTEQQLEIVSYGVVVDDHDRVVARERIGSSPCLTPEDLP